MPSLLATPAAVSAGLPMHLPSLSAPVIAALVVAALLLLLLLLAIWRVGSIARELSVASREGRRLSVVEEGKQPLTNFRRDGRPSDPLNVKILATAGQLNAAFTSAGWYRADEITLITSIRIALDSVLGRKYSTAPVSNLYLYGRKEDYAFERPGKSVRERDHVRFWDTGQRGPDGRPWFIGGATRDVAVELSKTTHLPTHKIGPDVDAERETVVDDLVATGWVVDEGWEPGFGKPTQTTNGGGDPYYTDGLIADLTLANIRVLPAAVLGVRGKAAAQLAQTATRPMRRVFLPKRGRERARQRRERRAAPVTVPANRPRSQTPSE